MIGKFYGIGVGPGDPELMTIKAKRILEEVDLIYTPVVKKEQNSRALSIVSQIVNCENKVEKMVFPMVYDQDKLKKSWQENTRLITDKLSQDDEIAFITIGDPLFYSTYIYLCKRVKEEYSPRVIETIPGVTSVQAASARVNLPLAQKREKLIILPEIPDRKEAKIILNNFDNIVILKISRNVEKFIRFLEKNNLIDNFVFISKCGYPEEIIIEDINDLKNVDIDYLSLSIVKKGAF